MNLYRQIGGAGLALALLAVGCAVPTPGGSPSGPAQVQQPRTLKRITVSMFGEPTSIIDRMNTAQVSIPGASGVEQIAHSALSEVTGDGTLQPALAEAVPTIENGLWRLLPEGRMETTWRIRQEARWHDGTPVTADDLVFTTTVDQDKELPILRPVGYQSVETVEAGDQRTITVRWSKPYIDADIMFTQSFASPIPRHLLEGAYNSDKTNFQALSYWSHEFVGTGPYTLREFAPGSHILFQANDRYLFGRPKIDEIEVRFIQDLNTIVTNLLAGALDMHLGRGFSIEHALQLRDQWRDGTTQVTPRSWIVIHPQFIGPNPPAVADVQFRRALMHATDRQALVDSLQGGLTGVSHVFLSPDEPEYRDVENAVVRYEYDPRKAAQMVEGLGYTRGPEGVYRDSGNQRLSLELRTYGIKVSDQATVIVAEAWTRFGAATEPLIVPPQRITDREYMATFPSFLMYRQPNSASARDISRLRGSLAPVADNRYVGSNYARYVNPEFDSLIDRYLTTIPKPERLQVLRQFVRHISENLNLMGLFYDAELSFQNNRLRGITAKETRLWNIHLWDTRERLP